MSTPSEGGCTSITDAAAEATAVGMPCSAAALATAFPAWDTAVGVTVVVATGVVVALGKLAALLAAMPQLVDGAGAALVVAFEEA